MLSKNFKEDAEQRVIRQLVEALMFEGLCHWEIIGSAKGRHHVDLTIQSLHLRAMARVNAFSRVFIEPGSLTQVDDCDPLKLTHIIQHLTGDGECLQKLSGELALTVKFCDWNQGRVRDLPSRRGLSYRMLECLLDEGHPYHPCFKSRVGFSEEDHLAYSPEMEGRFSLIELEICQTLIKAGEKTSKPAKICVHPWQWEKLKERLSIQQYLRAGRITYLGETKQTYTASQSIRTLIPADDFSAAHVKLPMQLVNTSSIRTLDTVSVLAAETLSDWLQGIVELDDYLSRSRVTLLREYGGVMFSGNEPDLEGQIGVLYRESPHLNFPRRYSIVPVNALMVYENDGRPHIDYWIKKYGLDAWVKQWIKVAILPLWHLLMRYAVGSEWHGQNTLLVLDNGWPTAVCLRDFHDGVEYVNELLPDGIEPPDFTHLGEDAAGAETHYRVDTFESVKDLVLECLFVFNMSEIAKVLVDYYQLSEEVLWSWVIEAIEDHHLEYPDLDTLYRANAEGMQVIKVESLLESKLRGKPEVGFHHHVVENPIQIKSYVCS